MSRYRLWLHILLISDIAGRPAPDPTPTLMDFLPSPGPGKLRSVAPAVAGETRWS